MRGKRTPERRRHLWMSSKELEAAMRKIMGDTEYIQELRKMKFAYKKKMEQANDERKQGGNSMDIFTGRSGEAGLELTL